jgi:23S rRNA (uracil1939-C5)-methyltransferase
VLEITALGNGPEAVGRHEGRVIFVPGAAPGDRMRVRVIEEHRNYARAVVMHRCDDGPARREPPCPWVDACGGCPWQHVAYERQLAAKAANVEDALARIGGVTPREVLPIIAAPAEWAYRHRIRLHVGAGGALGYRRARSHEVVAIEHCLIAEPGLSAVLAPLRTLLPTLATALDDVEVASNGRGAVVVDATAHGRFRAPDDARIRAWLTATPAVAGIAVRGRGWTRRFGATELAVASEEAAPARVQRTGSFTQVNPAANLILVRTVVDFVGAGARVLDLFSGAGNFSLALARAATSVVAVDQDAAAVTDGAASATAAGIRNLRFEIGAADRFLDRHGLAGAEIVVLDPPRSGAAAAVELLARLAPPRIVYVSCEPSTLARDVRTLAAAGYAVVRVQPIDMFPQTEHVETVLEAVLTAR